MVKPTVLYPETSIEKLKEIPPIKFRQWWGAREAANEIFMRMPVPFLHITYTGGEECHTEEHCMELVKNMQTRDIEQRGLPDIQYNFLVGGDGVLYEGVGWHTQSTKDREFSRIEGKCVDIAYIGDFKNKDPIDESIKVVDNFVQFMAKKGYLTNEYETIPLEKSRESKP